MVNRRVVVLLPESLLQEVDRVADREYSSRSAFIRDAMRHLLAEKSRTEKQENGGGLPKDGSPQLRTGRRRDQSGYGGSTAIHRLVVVRIIDRQRGDLFADLNPVVGSGTGWIAAGEILQNTSKYSPTTIVAATLED